MKRAFPSGYTLVELIVVMGISAVILAALMYFFSGSITSYRSQVGHVFVTADARTQVQRIVDTLRNAQNNLSTGEVWLVPGEAKNDSVIIWTDISGDGALEKVRYARSSTDPTKLLRTIVVGSDAGTTTVAQRLDPTASLFAYYDSNGSAIDEGNRTAETVETIGVNFVVSVPESSETQTITTKVTPRQKLQGTVSQTGNANGDREVTIELPRGTPPSATEPARLVIKDMATGATVVSKDISIATINDGRLRSYGTNDYAFINYKNASTLGNSSRWYIWLTWGVPVQQMSGAIALDNFYTSFGSTRVKCLGKTLSQALSNTGDCDAYTYAWGVPYKPILTYTENGFKDHVMDIYVKRPVLQSFKSTTANGTYGPGSTIGVRATYDVALAAGSTLTVRMDTGANVTLSTVSGKTISGTYTVGVTGSGENSNDLNVSSIVSESVTDTLTPANTRTNSAVPASPNNIRDGSNIVIDTTAPDAPIATPAGATYSATTSVELSAEAGARIRYTTDGTSPTSSSALYSGPIEIAASLTLKAIAIDRVGIVSSVMTEYYIIDPNGPPTTLVESRSPNTANNGGNTAAILLTITFSEAVSGFTASDVLVQHATKGALAGSGTTYTIPITPTVSGGQEKVVTVNIAANSVTDSAGSGNQAASEWRAHVVNIRLGIVSVVNKSIEDNNGPGPYTALPYKTSPYWNPYGLEYEDSLNTSRSAKKVCNLLGYSSLHAKGWVAYDGCSDNTDLYWDGSSWRTKSACSPNDPLRIVQCVNTTWY